jgi:hypothetical protein
LLRAKCLVCHEGDLIRQQRLSPAGWQRELDKMIRWGAAVKTEPERTSLVEYLAGLQAPRTQPSEASSQPGKDLLERRCLVCHQADLIEQQRLSQSGWAKEIDKMVRWGASMSDADKSALVTYLENRFGVR